MTSNVVSFQTMKGYATSSFGGCPVCGGEDGYMNVGATHWFYCTAHLTRWSPGDNLFSDWREETKAAKDPDLRMEIARRASELISAASAGAEFVAELAETMSRTVEAFRAAAEKDTGLRHQLADRVQAALADIESSRRQYQDFTS